MLDAQLISLKFDRSPPVAVESNDEMYLANYIIHKREGSSRIRIVKSDVFEACLADYERLHEFNCKVFGQQENEFYTNVLEDPKKVHVLIGRFQELVGNRLKWRVYDYNKKLPDFKSMGLSWNIEKKYVSIDLPLYEGEVGFLDTDSAARAIVAEALSDVYRYSGDFHFEEDIPF